MILPPRLDNAPSFCAYLGKKWPFNPWNHRKKSSANAPEPIYRLYFGRTCSLQKAQGSWSSNYFSIGSWKVIFLHQSFQILEFWFLVLENIVWKPRCSISRAHRSLHKFYLYGYQRPSIFPTSHSNPIRFIHISTIKSYF